MSLQRLTCEDTSGTLAHVCDPCAKELGRVRGVILFKSTFDWSTLIEKLRGTTSQAATEARTIFEQAIANGDAYLISETTGTYDGGAAQTGDGYGDDESRLLGYLYTLNYKDPSYAGNRDFYQAIELGDVKVCWRTETLLHFADKPATIQAIDPIEEDLSSAVVWDVTATWKSKNKPLLAPLDALSQYFDGCWGEGGSSPGPRAGRRQGEEFLHRQRQP